VILVAAIDNELTMRIAQPLQFHFGTIMERKLEWIEDRSRHEITCKADADNNRPERFFRRVCPNERLPELALIKPSLIEPRKELLHRCLKIRFCFFDRSVAGIFAGKTARVRFIRLTKDPR
jgi:hypothetical protein